jgi:hypothetical protein
MNLEEIYITYGEIIISILPTHLSINAKDSVMDPDLVCWAGSGITCFGDEPESRSEMGNVFLLK